METILEKIDAIRDRIDVTYADAKKALEKTNGSVIDAIVDLELKNKKLLEKKSPKKHNDFIKSEKRKLTFLLDNIVEDPSIPQEKKIALIIHSTALLCAIVAVQPIPFADLFVLSPIQLVMVTYLNKAIGNPYKNSEMKEIVSSLLGIVGWGVIAQQLILGDYKTFLPFIAGVTTIPLVYGATYALGKGAVILIESKKRDRTVSDEEIKRVVQAAKEEAKAGMKGISLSSIQKEFSEMYINASAFDKYKGELKEIEEKLRNMGIYNLNNTEEDMLLNSDVSKLYKRRYELIIRRFKYSYKSLAFNSSIYSILALLPPKVLLGEVEKVIGYMNNDITKLEISKPKCDSDFREVSTEFGIFHIIIQGKIIYLQYFEPSEKIKEEMALAGHIDAMNVSETNRIIYNQEIRQFLEKSLRSAKKEIDIISPWANFYVMNSLKTDFQSAIKRGVTIKIVYGIGAFNSDNKSNGDKRNEKTEKVMNVFYSYFKESNRFKIKRDNTHCKLLICDNSYYIQGSFNFLSYDGNGDRNEMAQYSQDKELLTILRNEHFAFD
jgi:uncharacterized protein (DUF697 family)/nucleoid DNA-binding protein